MPSRCACNGSNSGSDSGEPFGSREGDPLLPPPPSDDRPVPAGRPDDEPDEARINRGGGCGTAALIIAIVGWGPSNPVPPRGVGTKKGGFHVNSSHSTTPNEYTSEASVMGSFWLRNASGDIHRGVPFNDSIPV